MSFFEHLFRNMGRGGGHHGGGHHGGYGRYNDDPYARSGYPPPAEQRAIPGAITCAQCNTVNAPAAKFCQNCGSSVQPVSCPQCGIAIPAGSKFCPKCGKAVTPA